MIVLGDPVAISWIALLVATLALVLAVAPFVLALLDRPPHQHGPEVEDLDATFERAAAQDAGHQRRPEMSDDTVLLLRPPADYRGRYRRRG